MASRRKKRQSPEQRATRRWEGILYRLKNDGAEREDLVALLTMKDAMIGCAYCHLPVGPLEISVDHKMPKSRGGSSFAENLALGHERCNKIKGELTYDEYMELILFLDSKLPNVKNYLLRRLYASCGIYSR